MLFCHRNRLNNSLKLIVLIILKMKTIILLPNITLAIKNTLFEFIFMIEEATERIGVLKTKKLMAMILLVTK